MKYEKRNPIPPGVYWLDLLSNAQQSAFAAWVDSSDVVILKSETHELPNDAPFSWSGIQLPKYRKWVLFQVMSPTLRWPNSASLGLPTISDGAITSKGTSQAPEPKPAVDYWADQAKTAWNDAVASSGGAVARGLAVIALIYLISNNRK